MGSNGKQKKIIISVGGSLIVPDGGVDTVFLSNLNDFIRQELAKNPNRQFFLVIGGGTTARKYRDAGHTVLKHALTDEDLDWIGLHATRLNAQLVRTIFRDIAFPYIIKNYDIIRKTNNQVVVAAGWKPGWSTDYCATLICEDYNVQHIINLSNTDKVYDKDPNKFKDAKPKDKMTWKEFRALVGEEWKPGMHAPFDPIAAKRSDELGIEVVVMNGNDFKNVSNYLNGKDFKGTVIE
jgi:uridylate kinase